ncbi:MAG TPA: hypothetical protein DCY95_07630, partial [Algoriphagus sp.]|nr:hypothetical protein [Algoriphagus sp.]
PLKFLIRLLVDIYTALLTDNKELFNRIFTETIRPEDTSELMVIYGLGASGIFLVFVWLNVRSLKKKKQLLLSQQEILLTQNSVRINLAMGLIPLISVAISLFNLGGSYTFIISGFSYMLYLIIMPILAFFNSKRLENFKTST